MITDCSESVRILRYLQEHYERTAVDRFVLTLTRQVEGDLSAHSKRLDDALTNFNVCVTLCT